MHFDLQRCKASNLGNFLVEMLAKSPITELLAHQEGTRDHFHRCPGTHWASHCEHQRWVDLGVEVCMAAVNDPPSKDSDSITVLRLIVPWYKCSINFDSKYARYAQIQTIWIV